MTIRTIRPLTARFIKAMLFDSQLSPAMRVDFGVTDDNHHRAWQMAIRCGAGEQAVEAALGSGPKIAELIALFAPAWSHLEWHTSWDDLSADVLKDFRAPDDGEARLTAAAPALLAALQQCRAALWHLADAAGDVEEWNEGGFAYDASAAARQAVEKATGDPEPSLPRHRADAASDN